MPPAAWQLKGKQMAWRNILDRLNDRWSDVCVWWIRRSPLPADKSLGIVNRVATLLGLLALRRLR